MVPGSIGSGFLVRFLRQDVWSVGDAPGFTPRTMEETIVRPARFRYLVLSPHGPKTITPQTPTALTTPCTLITR